MVARGDDPDRSEDARRADRERLVDEMERRLSESLKRPSSGSAAADEDLGKTMDEVFDEPTLLTLYKLMTAGHIQTVDYPVSTGKEANVFHATDPDGGSLAVKIFRVNTATFRSFMTYIRGDPRFRDVGPNRRDVVHAWAQKEFKNLERLHRAGLPVPRPLAYRDNVLVMEFVGDEGTPAPRLKESPPADPDAAFELLMDAVEDMLEEAGLVHGDLSEFNVLHRPDAEPADRFVIIDAAQAVMLEHPMSGELLARDVENVVRFFASRGVDLDARTVLRELVDGLDEDLQSELGEVMV